MPAKRVFSPFSQPYIRSEPQEYIDQRLVLLEKEDADHGSISLKDISGLVQEHKITFQDVSIEVSEISDTERYGSECTITVYYCVKVANPTYKEDMKRWQKDKEQYDEDVKWWNAEKQKYDLALAARQEESERKQYLRLQKKFENKKGTKNV